MKFNKSTNVELIVTTLGRFLALGFNFILYVVLFKAMKIEDFAQFSLINGIQSFLLVVLLGPVLNVIGRETWVWFNNNSLNTMLFKKLQPLLVLYIFFFFFILLFCLISKWIDLISFVFYFFGILFYSSWIIFSSIFNVVGTLRNRILFTFFLFFDGLSKVLSVIILNSFSSSFSGAHYFFIIQFFSFSTTILLYYIFKNQISNFKLIFSLKLMANSDLFKIENYKIYKDTKSLNISSFFNWGASTGNRYVLEPLVTISHLGFFMAGFNLGTSILSAAEGFFTSYLLPILFNKTSNVSFRDKRILISKYLILWISFLLPILIIFLYYVEFIISYSLGENAVPHQFVSSGLIYSFGILFIGLAQSMSLINRNYQIYTRVTFINFIFGLSGLFFSTKYFSLVLGSQILALVSILSVLFFIFMYRKNFNFNELFTGCVKIIIFLLLIYILLFISGFFHIHLILQFFVLIIFWALFGFLIMKKSIFEFVV